MTFDNFVIRKDGTVKAIKPGTLNEHATADLLIKHLREIEGQSALVTDDQTKF